MATNRRDLTIEEARALADRADAQQEQWDAQADPKSWDNQVSAYYSHLSASDVVRLWEAGTNEKDQPLTRFELAALVEQWCRVFGCLPPFDDASQATPATSPPSETEPQPGDDDMMTRAVVARRLRASVSSVQRMEQDGRLPKPLRTGPRARRHLAKDVNALIERLEEERMTRASRR